MDLHAIQLCCRHRNQLISSKIIFPNFHPFLFWPEICIYSGLKFAVVPNNYMFIRRCILFPDFFVTTDRQLFGFSTSETL